MSAGYILAHLSIVALALAIRVIGKRARKKRDREEGWLAPRKRGKKNGVDGVIA